MLSNFRTALAVRGMKQADLAYKLHIPASTLSEIVHERRRPDARTRRRIAAILDVDEKWLFSRQIQIPKRIHYRRCEELSKVT